MPTHTEELMALAEARGLSDSSLDDAVQAAAILAASAANNDGLPGQIAFLIGQIGIDETRKIIEGGEEDKALAWFRESRPQVLELLNEDTSSDQEQNALVADTKLLTEIFIVVIQGGALNLSVDMVGEMLRSWAFTEACGCYSCFDLIEGFDQRPMTPAIAERLMGRPVNPQSADDDDQDILKRGFYAVHDNGIEVAWYWDGDGTLWFRVPGEIEVVNSDCKKDYEWKLVPKELGQS
jgi:hypothetical protein